MSTTSNTDFAGPLTIWLEQAITGLLTAPGPITIPKLPGGIIGGPGPIDLFSTRFANTFTADVKAEINGTDYDNAGLKAKLANIKSVFNPETTTFERSVEKDGRSADNGEVGLLFTWTGKKGDTNLVDIEAAEVSLDADVVNDGGEPKINKVVIVTQSLPTAV